MAKRTPLRASLHIGWPMRQKFQIEEPVTRPRRESAFCFYALLFPRFFSILVLNKTT